MKVATAHCHKIFRLTTLLPLQISPEFYFSPRSTNLDIVNLILSTAQKCQPHVGHHPNYWRLIVMCLAHVEGKMIHYTFHATNFKILQFQLNKQLSHYINICLNVVYIYRWNHALMTVSSSLRCWHRSCALPKIVCLFGLEWFNKAGKWIIFLLFPSNMVTC